MIRQPVGAAGLLRNAIYKDRWLARSGLQGHRWPIPGLEYHLSPYRCSGSYLQNQQKNPNIGSLFHFRASCSNVSRVSGGQFGPQPPRVSIGLCPPQSSARSRCQHASEYLGHPRFSSADYTCRGSHISFSGSVIC